MQDEEIEKEENGEVKRAEKMDKTGNKEEMSKNSALILIFALGINLAGIR